MWCAMKNEPQTITCQRIFTLRKDPVDVVRNETTVQYYRVFGIDMELYPLVNKFGTFTSNEWRSEGF